MKLRHLALAALSFLPATAHAQTPSPVCFGAAPAAACRSFLVTQLSLSTREYGSGTGTEYHYQWEAGAMANVTPRDAVGATFVFGAPRSGHWGAAGRYRRWLHPDVAIDVAPGFLIVGNEFDGKRMRLSADLSLSFYGWFAGFVHGESSRDGGRGGVGVTVGEWPGLILGTALYGLASIVPQT
jgi:hypothetical protein